MSETRQSESRSHDLVVVGAGVIGLAIAWRAARRGLRTLVLEGGEPAGGATGVAAGMLAPVTEADFGEERLRAANRADSRGLCGSARRRARGGGSDGRRERV